jgi:putative membrane protein
VVYISNLPSLNAFLNATSAVLLVVGYRYIRRRNIRAHRICMVSAFAVSVLFLLSYLTYHYHVGSTSFSGQGWIRPVYFTILISHTVLAALVPLLSLITLFQAWKEQFTKHRRVARWTLPVWLYVSVTGVIIYFLLYHLYAPA